jgi:hypothetical protein
MPKKYHSYCCIISFQLDLTFQKKEAQNSYQINTFLLKLATELLLEKKNGHEQEQINQLKKEIERLKKSN